MERKRMANEIIYIKAEQNTEVKEPKVTIGDIASVFCVEEHMAAKVKSLTVFQFHKENPKRQVVSIMKVIELILKEYPKAEVQNLGEDAVLLEWINVDKHKGPAQWLKLVFVSLITFFGVKTPADASAPKLSLEISYSIGLAIGIIVFFNHIGGRRITKDPTPIEVEMRIYEKDVNTSLIETSDREGDTLDV